MGHLFLESTCCHLASDVDNFCTTGDVGKAGNGDVSVAKRNEDEEEEDKETDLGRAGGRRGG